MVTEIIAFQLREGISNEQLVSQVEALVNDFHKKQDGYIDLELVKNSSSTDAKMILHYESMNDIEKVAAQVPNSNEIKEFSKILVPESIDVSFFEKLNKWL